MAESSAAEGLVEESSAEDSVAEGSVAEGLVVKSTVEGLAAETEAGMGNLRNPLQKKFRRRLR